MLRRCLQTVRTSPQFWSCLTDIMSVGWIAASAWKTGSLSTFFGLVINTPLVQGYLLVEQ